MIPEFRWLYRAKINRDIDGDTIVVTLDKGHRDQRVEEHIRILRVNTPEDEKPTKEAGHAATLYTGEWLAVAAAAGLEWPLIIETYKSDDFGRWLGDVWRVVDGANLSDDLYASGHAALFPKSR